MQLGDARAGKLAGNLAAFGRALRRAGVPVDASRMALASEALVAVGLGARQDVEAALEAVLVGREADRQVFRELFEAFFRDPEIANKLLAQMLPSAEGKAEPVQRRARVREALAPPATGVAAKPPRPDEQVDFDAAMTASDLARLHHADFQSLSASEYRLVLRLARDIPLRLPTFATRRLQPGPRGARMDWPAVMRQAVRHGGELVALSHRQRRRAPLPVVVLVDVSGSMERYARLLLAFLHAATQGLPQRAFFAFGTQLTDLTPAMRIGDSDAMLEAASRAIHDFAGGTQLGASLATLRLQHARRLVGRRTPGAADHRRPGHWRARGAGP
jgi:uncharacterized protein with von Willebrand factor type A (vWA) domain